jgi:hypothetical protein
MPTSLQLLKVPVSVPAYAAFRVRSAKLGSRSFGDKAPAIPHKALGVSRYLELCIVCIYMLA